MAKWNSVFLALICTLFQTFVLGYKIDQSCTKQGVEDLVRDAMRSAFDMVAAARDRLEANPLDRDTAELIGFLFAKQNANPTQLQATGQLTKTLDVFRNIYNNFRIEFASNNDVLPDDVIIYCDFDRFVVKDANKQIYIDQTTGIYVHFKSEPCRGGSLADKVSLAVTWNPSGDESLHEVEEGNKPTQIQICPWFLDWLKNRDFKLSRDVFRTNIGRLVIKGAESDRFGLRQIDAFSLLDKVLLHEMTHARSAYERLNTDGDVVQEGLLDVPNPAGFNRLLPNIWKIPAYGWNAAMTLARKGEDLGGSKAPDNNADTLALFGSVCKLMDDTTSPRKVDVDGKIIPRG